MKQPLILIFVVYLTSFYKRFVILFMPELGLQLGFIMFLPAISTFTTVFLMDEKPAVLLLDEPELSLHITWQEKLLDALRKLNPACQIIMTTHSPSIFVNGWRDHLVFVDNLIK